MSLNLTLAAPKHLKISKEHICN